MCGFLQIVTRNERVAETAFLKALDTLQHRGPDAEGTRFVQLDLTGPVGPSSVGLGYGHRRLSIIDLDARSNQPFRHGSRTLVFNGEIYNFAHVKAALSGFPFRTRGDTEVLMAALSRDDLDGLSDMSGMWSFVLTDEAAGNLLAARDRYGKKPLFYYLDDHKLILSSNIRAIGMLCGQGLSIRPDFLDSYLAHGVAFPGGHEQTHLHGIRQVRPGGYLRFDMRTWRPESGQWFAFDSYVRHAAVDSAGLPSAMREAVVSRLVSDRQVGLLLSGGIDSTLVLSVIHSEGLQDGVHCFIGETGRSQDAFYARQCVAQLGIKAHVINLDYDSTSFERFLRMCLHHEKPFPLLGNSMAMSEMYEKISGFNVPVVLDGTGGDEVFGGYWDRQYPFAIGTAMANRDARWLTETARSNGRVFWKGLWTRFFKGIDLHKHYRRLVPQPNFAVERFCRTEVFEASSLDPLTDRKMSFSDALLSDMGNGRLGEWIWHNDRNAMMSSIENRSPFLDFRLAPFSATGYAAKFVGPWNKHELRKTFDAFTPLPTQWRRQKQGFRWNAREFYHRNADRILELIAASRILPERVEVKSFLDAVRSDRRYIASRLTPRLLCIAGIEATLGVGMS